MRSTISKACHRGELRILPIFFAAVLIPLSNARAAEIEGVRFPDELQMGEAQLQLRGTGLLRYRTFIKAYVAALYVDASARGEDVLGDQARRLEIEYFWSVPAHRFAQATTDGIARNVEAAALQALDERIAAFNGLYEDVEPGDRYAITYIPGRGTELSLNGEARGTIEGSDFASALFAIWLGPNPLDDDLRRMLLARR